MTLGCSFTVSFNYYGTYWYQQPSSGEMIYVINQHSIYETSREVQHSVVLRK